MATCDEGKDRAGQKLEDRSQAHRLQTLIMFSQRRMEPRGVLFISISPLKKTPCPRLDSPANSPWCHPPGVQWLMHSGCQLLASWRQGNGTRRLRWEGLIFPQIETSKCEQGPARGRFRAQANSLHTCRTVNAAFNVVAPCSQSLLMFQTRSQAEIGGDGPPLGLMEVQRGEKARLWLCTSTWSSFWVLLHIRAEGRQEGKERWKGVLWVEE